MLEQSTLTTTENGFFTLHTYSKPVSLGMATFNQPAIEGRMYHLQRSPELPIQQLPTEILARYASIKLHPEIVSSTILVEKRAPKIQLHREYTTPSNQEVQAKGRELILLKKE